MFEGVSVEVLTNPAAGMTSSRTGRRARGEVAYRPDPEDVVTDVLYGNPGWPSGHPMPRSDSL